MAIRYYVDADLIGLGRLLVQASTEFTYAGDPGGIGVDSKYRPPSPIAPGQGDPEWIPVAAARRWVVITRDRHMRSRPDERQQMLQSAARHIRLEGAPGQRRLRKWDQLELLMVGWRRIEELSQLPGPWAYVVTRSGLRKEL